MYSHRNSVSGTVYTFAVTPVVGTVRERDELVFKLDAGLGSIFDVSVSKINFQPNFINVICI